MATTKEHEEALTQLCKTCKLNETEGFCEYYSRGIHNLCLNYTRKTGEAAASPIQASSALNSQIGGEHYKKFGDYQPWQVLAKWLTPEELKGFAKGTVIAYLAREADKGGRQDIEKSMHTLQLYLELSAKEAACEIMNTGKSQSLESEVQRRKE